MCKRHKSELSEPELYVRSMPVLNLRTPRGHSTHEIPKGGGPSQSHVALTGCTLGAVALQDMPVSEEHDNLIVHVNTPTLGYLFMMGQTRNHNTFLAVLQIVSCSFKMRLSETLTERLLIRRYIYSRLYRSRSCMSEIEDTLERD